MALGINRLALTGYYSGIVGKTIQKSFKFLVTFLDNDQPWTSKGKLKKDIGSMPIIKPWHIVDVSVPQYPFGKDHVQYGPLAKTIPVMQDFNGFIFQ